jgi:2-polyprenyl-3-methyl-5-hydroxy-6-metoxy-1,4-benzoquinol methylase
MKWFGSRPAKDSENKTESESSIQPTLALAVLFRQLRTDRKYHILDFGSASGANIDFLSRYPCRITVEDLHHTLASFDIFAGRESASDYQTIIEYLFPYQADTRFDIILAWDVLNYLERSVLEHLMAHIMKFSHNGTVLHAMISTARHIPDKPAQHRILDEANLLCQNDCAVLRPAPRYTEIDLKHMMAGFRVYSSYLLRNGMKEYLFVCE